MQKLKFIFIGKMRTSFFKSAEEHYFKSLGRFYEPQVRIIRDSNKPSNLRAVEESAKVLGCLQTDDYSILLEEKGRSYSSAQLADKLAEWTRNASRTPLFIVGGPYGFTAEVGEACRESLSLSAGTMPHELARVVLLESLYRAATILKGFPYHHI